MAQLTDYQRRVVAAYAASGSSKLVAADLGVSAKAVARTLARARARAGAQTTVELVVELTRAGELER